MEPHAEYDYFFLNCLYTATPLNEFLSYNQTRKKQGPCDVFIKRGWNGLLMLFFKNSQ